MLTLVHGRLLVQKLERFKKRVATVKRIKGVILHKRTALLGPPVESRFARGTGNYLG